MTKKQVLHVAPENVLIPESMNDYIISHFGSVSEFIEDAAISVIKQRILTRVEMREATGQTAVELMGLLLEWSGERERK